MIIMLGLNMQHCLEYKSSFLLLALSTHRTAALHAGVTGKERRVLGFNEVQFSLPRNIIVSPVRAQSNRKVLRRTGTLCGFSDLLSPCEF